ncbi:hypothetical protein SAMN02745181_0295 [Rubritalea squalenifaciens DSM 18772]|uniref:Uncharacterized protein n=1 Tax=Rubritalea squalenifaciens DSM 18772 TaxID=1123071 RepID=A0A1M6BRY6_9BACT|nr:hypothetical protein [Rubritalea squalenifaciens]SHI51540.1 hypothetical protein SAMN02745181_0295 [Rubritalea squalenifaciens DSM 18772]
MTPSPLKLLIITLLSISLCKADDINKANNLAREYCQKEFAYMGSYGERDSRVVHGKMYLHRMLELNDAKLNAYYAKHCINQEIRMYQNFLSTKKAWKNANMTVEQQKDFTLILEKLQRDLAIIEKHYPTDYDVFDKLPKPPFPKLSPEK